MARNLLVINQYYAPDVASSGQLLSDLCAGLVLEGFKVTVVTAQPSYTSSTVMAPAFEIVSGVRVYRVPLGRTRGRESLRSRVVGYAKFMWRAWLLSRAIVEDQRPDTVLTLSNPPSVGLIGARLAKRFGIRFVYVLYDIHPDILAKTSWVKLPRPALNLWNAMNKQIFSHADTVIVPGYQMKRTLVEEKGVREFNIKVIPNWGRPEFEHASKNYSVRKQLGVGESDILFLYAGNMGIMHPIAPILDAATRVHEQPIHFLFVGDGAKKQYLLSRIRDENIRNVSWLPFQPEQQFANIVAASDACFVTLEHGLESYAVPSKAYTFLSGGRALITNMAEEADIAKLVTDEKVGWNIANGAGLGELLCQIASYPSELTERGLRGRALYERCFRKDKVIREYARLLGSATEP